MSKQFPVIAITGSSGAGTSSVLSVFEGICHAAQIPYQTLGGDAMHRYDRHQMDIEFEKYRQNFGGYFSHFNPKANLLKELALLFKAFGEHGKCQVRNYIHTVEEGIPFNQAAGTLTPWRDSAEGARILIYEGLHGGYVGEDADVVQFVDLLIGVVPSINLEWIQKMHRDPKVRGYSRERVIEVILSRMSDYVHYICPQFSRTYVNFQRVPIVDTSNPFLVNEIPSQDESVVVVRFAKPDEIDFSYLLCMLHGAMMTRPDTLLIPGGKMNLAMKLIFTPMIERLMLAQAAASGI